MKCALPITNKFILNLCSHSTNRHLLPQHVANFPETQHYTCRAIIILSVKGVGKFEEVLSRALKVLQRKSLKQKLYHLNVE